MERSGPSGTPAAAARPVRRLRRREYAALAAVGVTLLALSLLLFVADWDVASLRRYGYAGVFLANLVGAAGIILPVPSLAAVFGGGSLLDPVLGVPAPLAIGLVAGLGEAIGEFTGYLAGYGSRAAFAEGRLYARLERWMARRGVLTLFAVSVIPNPLFDVAGALAGAAQMPVWRFFLTVLAGKVIKATYVASAGLVSIGLLQDLFS
ncbi:MAG TPA: VTT domain-containing protein [Dehalococcoidia bacterium]